MALGLSTGASEVTTGAGAGGFVGEAAAYSVQYPAAGSFMQALKVHMDWPCEFLLQLLQPSNQATHVAGGTYGCVCGFTGPDSVAVHSPS